MKRYTLRGRCLRRGKAVIKEGCLAAEEFPDDAGDEKAIRRFVRFCQDLLQTSEKKEIGIDRIEGEIFEGEREVCSIAVGEGRTRRGKRSGKKKKGKK